MLNFRILPTKRKIPFLTILLFILINIFVLSFEIRTEKNRRNEFCIGGTAYDWLGMRLWGGLWTEIDPLEVLWKSGVIWNRVGVLIKHSPPNSTEGWCSVEYAEEVMNSSVKNGMRLDLFFYLSHTAAHAGQQPCPPEWENFTVEEKTNALYQYCYETTKYYKDRGLDIEIYEMGNEIDFGILDERPTGNVDWFDINYLKTYIWNKEAPMLKGAIEGVKQADPDAKTLLHLAVSSRPDFVFSFFKYMIEFGVSFDLAGLSFYPSYTGSERPNLDTLKKCVDEIASLGKKTLICEYSYPSSPSPEDPVMDGAVEGYQLTPEGQAKHVADFIRWCYKNPNVLGVIYFYPDNFLSEYDPIRHPGPHTALFYNDTTVKPSLEEFRKFKETIFQEDDLLGTWMSQGVYYRDSDTGNWMRRATPAEQIAAGDIDNDCIDDLIGIWPAQGGVWVKYSSSGSWVLLSSTADWIGAGDMNGDGQDDLLGTWTGQGVFYKDSVTGSWVKMATPATQIAAGDLDDDGSDDLIGIWPAQGGVWVKYSSSGNWARLSSTADWIAAGDMNGDGWDDLLGTWTGQGVYYKDSDTGSWVKMATPATQITAGDIDGDSTDDLLGIWPAQGGVWVKYSSDSTWERLSSTADWIAAGKMRNASSSSTEVALSTPIGGIVTGPSLLQEHEDLSSYGPWGLRFKYIEEKNIRVGSEIDEDKQSKIKAGPGEPGFTCAEQNNLVPGKGLKIESDKKKKERTVENFRR